jgi:hypothetical protein
MASQLHQAEGDGPATCSSVKLVPVDEQTVAGAKDHEQSRSPPPELRVSPQELKAVPAESRELFEKVLERLERVEDMSHELEVLREEKLELMERVRALEESWRTRYLRFLESRHYGFKPTELKDLLIPVASSLYDLQKDVRFIVYAHGVKVCPGGNFSCSDSELEKKNWWLAGVTIEIVSGFLGVFVFAPKLRTRLASLGCDSSWVAWLVGLIVCILGLEQLVLVVLVLRSRTDPQSGVRDVTQTGWANAIFESLAQTALVLFVSLRYIDESGERDAVKSWGQVLEFCVGLIMRGYTVFGCERLARHSLSSVRYLVVKSLANGCEIAAMIFYITLVVITMVESESIPVGASIAIWSVCVLVIIALTWGKLKMYGTTAEGLPRCLRQLSTPVCGSCSCMTYGQLLRYVVVAVVCLLVHIFGSRHLGVEEGSQSLSKAEADEGLRIYFGISLVLVIAHLVLMPLSWVFDPERGWKGWRDSTWEEMIADETTGMTDEAVARAKVVAVWEWADVLGNGVLEEEEVDRLVEETGCRCGVLYAALEKSDLRLSVSQGTPRKRLSRERFISTCEGEGQQVEQWFATLKLHLVKKESVAHKILRCVCGDFDDADVVNARDKILNSPSRRSDATTRVRRSSAAFGAGSGTTRP